MLLLTAQQLRRELARMLAQTDSIEQCQRLGFGFITPPATTRLCSSKIEIVYEAERVANKLAGKVHALAFVWFEPVRIALGDWF